MLLICVAKQRFRGCMRCRRVDGPGGALIKWVRSGKVSIFAFFDFLFPVPKESFSKFSGANKTDWWSLS